MRLKTPTQVVMLKENWGNIHTHFFGAGYSMCKGEVMKSTFKLLTIVWLHFILPVWLQDLSLPTS